MTTKSAVRSLVGIGIFAGAFAWMLHQLTAYVIASMVCTQRHYAIWGISLLCFGLIAAGSAISWNAVRQTQEREGAVSQTRMFIASIAIMACLLFVFAITLQASALLIIPSCAT